MNESIVQGKILLVPTFHNIFMRFNLAFMNQKSTQLLKTFFAIR